MIKDTGFITIQGWMINKLNLSGTDLLVYAIIYGFSQDDESMFTGSRQYLADWCNCSVRTIQTTLNNLVEKNLLTKYENVSNNIKYCNYVANFPSGEKISPPSEKISPPREKISPYNIDNNINNNIDNTISKDIVDESTLEKPKKLSLYEKAIVSIEEYTDDEILRNALVEYLKVRLAIREDGKGIKGIAQWNALLRKLKTLTGDPVAIVENATAHGWASFYEVNNNSNYYKRDIKKVSGETSKMKFSKMSDAEREEAKKNGAY